MITHTSYIHCRRGTRQRDVLHVQKNVCSTKALPANGVSTTLSHRLTWIPPLISTRISVPKSSASVPTAVALHRRRLPRAEFALTASTELGAVAAGIATSGWHGAMRGLTAKQDTEVGSTTTSAAHRSLIRLLPGCLLSDLRRTQQAREQTMQVYQVLSSARPLTETKNGALRTHFCPGTTLPQNTTLQSQKSRSTALGRTLGHLSLALTKE